MTAGGDIVAAAGGGDAEAGRAVHNLEDVLGGLSALEVLDAVAWDGPEVDPGVLVGPAVLAYL